MTESKIKISVIVPIYNVKKYLDECITSICKQSIKELEIILVDDGSTDGSGEICEKYAQKDTRVRVIHKPNGGLVSARKAGLRIARGSYIGYVDGDDFIKPDMYERMYLLAKKEKAQVVATGITMFDEKASYARKNRIDSGVYEGNALIDVRRKMLFSGVFYEPGIMPSLCNKLFEKELLYDFQMSVPEEIKMGEDVCCSYPLLMQANKIVIDNEYTSYYYRNTIDSMTSKYDDKFFERARQLREYLNQQIKASYMQDSLNIYWIYLVHLGMERLWSRKANTLVYSDKIEIMNRLSDEKNIYEKYFKLPIPLCVKFELWAIERKAYFMLYFITRICKKII